MNARTPWMMAVDLDGTLLNRTGEVSVGCLRSLRLAWSAGWTVVLATGRSWSATASLVERYPELAAAWTICADGALVRPPASAPAFIRTVTAAELCGLRTELPDLVVVVEWTDRIFSTTRLLDTAEFPGEQHLVTWDAIARLPGLRLYLRTAVRDVPSLTERLEVLPAYAPVVYRIGDYTWSDVVAAGVSKGSSLELVRSRLDLDPAHTVAIGDSWNDIPMFEWADLSVATIDAPEQVRAAADITVAAGDDDGVMHLVVRLLTGDRPRSGDHLGGLAAPGGKPQIEPLPT